MDGTVRLASETFRNLKMLGIKYKIFDVLLTLLVDEQVKTVREGAGLWSGTNAA